MILLFAFIDERVDCLQCVVVSSSIVVKTDPFLLSTLSSALLFCEVVHQDGGGVEENET